MVKTLAMARAEEDPSVDPKFIEKVALDLIELPVEVLELLEKVINGDTDSCTELGNRYKGLNSDADDSSSTSDSGDNANSSPEEEKEKPAPTSTEAPASESEEKKD